MSFAILTALAAATATPADIRPLPLQPIGPAAQRLCAAKVAPKPGAPAAGLGIKLLRPGTGPSPKADDIALVNYIGYLAATGAVFDQGQQQAFPVGAVIPGFTQGLLTLQKGAISRFCIPAALGYGADATGPIPANADLVFQVELVDFKSQAEVEAMRAAAGAPAPASAGPAKP
jgi:FKBP-type peptidyl-prolyl cis-trans isomerase FkpA